MQKYLYFSLVLISSLSSYAAIPGRWYVSGSSGYENISNTNASVILTASDAFTLTSTIKQSIHHDNTSGGRLAFGFLYKDFPGWSTEIEAQVRHAPNPTPIQQTVSVLNPSATILTQSTSLVEKFAHIPQYAVMLNAQYEHPVYKKFKLALGGGVGFGVNRLKYKFLSASTGRSLNASQNIDQNLYCVLFAFQGMVRGIIPLNDRLDLFGGYRIIGTARDKVTHHIYSVASAKTTLSIETTETPLIHIAELGLRLKL